MWINKTIFKIWDINVKVKTFGNEKVRISVLLRILVKGDKLSYDYF